MPEKTVTDERLLELLASEFTFEQGFGLLVAAYKQRLYWHIRRIVLTHEDADDALQNTFVKVYKGIAQFEGKSKLFTWMYRIATNEAISLVQQRNRHATGSLDGNDVADLLKADPWFEGDETQLLLLTAIAGLPEKQRLVFHLRYYDEMPYEEMSELLGTSVGALKASFHHAVKKIEQSIRVR
jgi:RNA polymerase sigma-70 factor (ECF subfamily)